MFDFCLQKMRLLTMPARDWGPALPQHRKLVKEYIDDLVIDPYEMMRPKSFYNYGFNSTTTLGSVKVMYIQVCLNCWLCFVVFSNSF